jgi:hypothetical protein
MEKVIVIDELNMVRIWLEEKVWLRLMTPQQADETLVTYETRGKQWVSPIKDTLGSGKLAIKLARDMRTWTGGRVYFSQGKIGDLVVIKGWPNGRKLVPGVRYRTTNPKVVQLQIGKPGLRVAAKESVAFGIVFVTAIDVADYVLRDKATLGQLLGGLSVDIPSVIIASAAGYAAGAALTGTVIGTFACGPFLVALVVGIAVGYGLFRIDEYFQITNKLSDTYDRGLARFREVWLQLESEADDRFRRMEKSLLWHDLSSEAKQIARTIGLVSHQPRLRAAG